ncbi:glycosyltransferase [Tateyamaria sp. syn59]|uniref:glycosyltransferase n=1 Tax=Tateyamaria sp. syn59 TaxID=2576942 RepID=UPI0011BFB92C|nr:glycosyltransferase [Tateyamaria sp. syn59]
MQVVFQMRYSYFGKSGWRSRASRDPARLFSEERLKKRAYFFEKIALASLASQQDEDFKLVLLSSAGLPEQHKTYLTEICNDTLGAHRTHVIFRPPQKAGRCFRKHQHETLNTEDYTAQIVLDDDDAVSSDFVDVMRREALAMTSLFRAEDDYCYLSQAQGLSAVFDNGTCKLLHRTVPFNTQGLMLVARTQTQRNPFFTAHKRIGQRHPARAIYGRVPYFIRAVHDLNDSRTMFGDDLVQPDEMADVTARFPMLNALLADHAPIALAAE